MGKDQSLEYLKKKMEGLSPRTVEGKCLVVFSFCQAPLALLKFYDGLPCSFEANVTLFRLPEVGNCSVEFLMQDKMSCWWGGQRGGKIFRGNESLKPSLQTKAWPRLFTLERMPDFKGGSARGAKGRHMGRLMKRGILFEVSWRTWWVWGWNRKMEVHSSSSQKFLLKSFSIRNMSVDGFSLSLAPPRPGCARDQPLSPSCTT